MRALVPVAYEAAQLFMGLLHHADELADEGKVWPGFSPELPEIETSEGTLHG